MRLNIDESLARQAVEMKGISAQDLSNTFGRRDEPIITHSELPTSSKIDRNIKNQFLASAFEAFKSHWGFVLSPSQIFLLLIQQISLHVNAHPEELRSQFVNHEGKKELRVMVSASPSAYEWASAIENIREQIAANTVPDTYDLFSLQEFSTTTSIEQVAGDIALMDVCQSYFSYLFRTMCGIPFFLLQGSVEDWETLREKAEQVILRKTLPDFSARWLPALLPVLDKIVRARRGEEVDSAFWNSFVKIGAVHGSGGYTYASGWINSFFPLVSSKQANPYCVPLESNPIYLEYVRGGGAALKKAAAERGGRGFHREPVTGLDVSDYPSGVSAVPANWDRNGLSISLSVKSGFVGAVFEEGAIQPAVGWWIVESKEKKGEGTDEIDFDS